MKRLHVHVAVEDIGTNIAFYTALFGAGPGLRKPDYAKWELDDPRVNFAISARGAPPGLDHLGIQVESGEELGEVRSALAGADAPVTGQTGTACCYARSDKYWITDPQGVPWEAFHTLESVPTFNGSAQRDSDSACCTPSSTARSCC